MLSVIPSLHSTASTLGRAGPASARNGATLPGSTLPHVWRGGSGGSWALTDALSFLAIGHAARTATICGRAQAARRHSPCARVRADAGSAPPVRACPSRSAYHFAVRHLYRAYRARNV